ncbi:MAG TPA: SIMPL domain-containing protein [Sandaracinaceae bacterium LLY-WYZ-13_1]|nr:SIMPL domain-containing protein [Sandaracinaceae bacterium LLY-WYZ-13_1]
MAWTSEAAMVPVALTALLITSCGLSRDAEPAAPEVAFEGEPTSSDGYWSRSRTSAAPDVGPLEAELHDRFVVPPDRALVRVDATVRAPTRVAVVGRVRDVAAELTETLGAGDACDAAVHDYGAVRRGDERWTARATLRLDVPLGDLEDAGARLARVEACMQRFEALGPSLRGVELAVSDARPTIDDPGRHRAALLQRALAPLHEVAAVEGPPAAFAPGGLSCTSRGEVTIAARSLHGIALRVDLSCRPRGEPSAEPEPTPSEPAT